jgi:peptidoglycan/LPS O-acetylase OafA/YrhL
MKKIAQIEGLRGYLAFWVRLDHLLVAGGYSVQQLSGIFRIIRQGWFAVDLFIIISGFVIFNLLDNQKEKYFPFITRRFFRLWPLFILLFTLTIPLSNIYLDNVLVMEQIHTDKFSDHDTITKKILSWKDHMWIHIFLHVPMLHGAIPDNLVPYAPSAFLGPAWSISLEWQFYLLAPFFFAFLLKCPSKNGLILSFLSVILFMSKKYIPEVQHGAFLPIHIEFFYTGVCSYFLFKFCQNKSFNFPIATLLSILLWVVFHSNANVIPFSLWICFLGLIIDQRYYHQCGYWKIFSYMFTNRLSQYLGKLSYSIYLSHFLVIIVLQSLLLKVSPDLSRLQHVLLLSTLTCLITVIISHILFHFIECPAMKLGAKIAMNPLLTLK